MLLSLHLLIDTMRPVEASKTLRDLLHAITRDPLLTVVLSAALSWAAHSSVAAMLFIMSLAGANVITLQATLAMVLVANLGSALNLLPSGLGKNPAHLRLPIGNLANRLVGCALVLPFVEPLSRTLLSLDQSPARLAADFHLAFNVALAMLFIGPLPWIARLLTHAFPERALASDPGAPQYLDQDALANPTVAVSNASREVLRMTDVVEAMLRGSQDAFHRDDPDKFKALLRKAAERTVEGLWLRFCCDPRHIAGHE